MGREIRKVPPNWDHPKVMRANGMEGYQPMFDETFKSAAKRWKDEFFAWENGERPDCCGEESSVREFWEWDGGPPDREYYRPWEDGEATWYQVWETVSEGTPVSPPFKTKEELIEYLVENGDFWDQKRRAKGGSVLDCEPWTRQQAEAFVNGPGWAPSMVITNGECMSGVEAVARQSMSSEE